MPESLAQRPQSADDALSISTDINPDLSSASVEVWLLLSVCRTRIADTVGVYDTVVFKILTSLVLLLRSGCYCLCVRHVLLIQLVFMIQWCLRYI